MPIEPDIQTKTCEVCGGIKWCLRAKAAKPKAPLVARGVCEDGSQNFISRVHAFEVLVKAGERQLLMAEMTPQGKRELKLALQKARHFIAVNKY